MLEREIIELAWLDRITCATDEVASLFPFGYAQIFALYSAKA